MNPQKSTLAYAELCQTLTRLCLGCIRLKQFLGSYFNQLLKLNKLDFFGARDQIEHKMQWVKNSSTTNSMSFHSLGSNMVYQHIYFVIGAPLNKVPIQCRCSSSFR